MNKPDDFIRYLTKQINGVESVGMPENSHQNNKHLTVHLVYPGETHNKSQPKQSPGQPAIFTNYNRASARQLQGVGLRIKRPRDFLIGKAPQVSDSKMKCSNTRAAIRGRGRAAPPTAAWAGRGRRARRSSPAATHHQGLSTWSADRPPLQGLIEPKSGRNKTCLSRRLCGGTVMRKRTDRGPRCLATC